jgi:hypothetical protein
MIHLTATTKIAAAAVALSLGWIVLSACECDETSEQQFPGFWVTCVGGMPTLMTYNGNSVQTVTNSQAGNFNPADWDCMGDSSSPQYKGSQSDPPFTSSSPQGPNPNQGDARPHASAMPYSFLPENVRDLPFTPDVPPATSPVCRSTFPDVLRTNHPEGTVTRWSTCPFANKTTIPVFQNPLQVQSTPDGTLALVTSFGSLDGTGGAVSIINLSTNQVTSTVMMPFGVTPNGLAISPDSTTAYIGNFTAPGQSILVMNIATQTITATIPNVVNYPSGMTITPDGSQVWVGSPLGGEVDVIDTLTNTMAYRLNIGSVTDIAFNSTGTTAYITSAATSPGKVYAVNTSTFQVSTTYTVGNSPGDIAMSYGNRFLVVNNDIDGSETVIDLVENKQLTIQLGSSINGIAMLQ